VLVEDGTDGTAVDVEPVAQFIGRRARSVALYQHLDLVLIEMSRPPWLRPVGGQRRQRWALAVLNRVGIVAATWLVGHLFSFEFDECLRDLLGIGRAMTDTTNTELC
jgi:hypothetical protein